jgi:hypothetical protein
MLEIRCSKRERLPFRKATLAATPIWNLYNGLDGSFFTGIGNVAAAQQAVTGGVILPKTKEKQVRSSIVQALEKRTSVVTDSAKARYDSVLSALGIPQSVEHVSIDATTLAYIPFYVGLLSRRGTDRMVAVDAHTGQKIGPVGSVLTSNLSYVLGFCAPKATAAR